MAGILSSEYLSLNIKKTSIVYSAQDNIEEETLKETENTISKPDSYENIKHSTKQSSKIAQLSRNIEEQVNR